jgi:pimeloyl-ACP methyl ester carboxylesterase
MQASAETGCAPNMGVESGIFRITPGTAGGKHRGMNLSRSLPVALVAAACLAAVPAAAPVAAARSSATIAWHTCGDQQDAQCATLRLPVDWSDPGGATFGFAIARRPATDPSARVGTLIFGPGGPSDSGVDRVANGAHRFSDDLRRHFDIVSFDPRGVVGSNPVVCSPGLLAQAPAPVLKSQADFDATVAYNRRLWADCRARTGPVFDHADTESTVRDLDALRAALGERTLTFQGSSYGTLLGEEYAERYPDRVRAIVLESVVDHSVGTSGLLTTQAWALQDSFDAFVAWCDTDATCALHGQDVRAVFAGLLADADAGRLGMAPFDLVATVHGGVKGPDFPKLAQLLAALNSGTPGKPVGNLGVVVPVFCSDWSLPVRDYSQYAAVLRQAATVAPDVRYPAQVFALTMCLGWPKPVANPQHVLHVRTSIPLLLLNSRHDPATGYNWAQAVARQLGRHGVLVTYQGAGHGSYTLSDCMQQIADRYLIALTVPRRGTIC